MRTSYSPPAHWVGVLSCYRPLPADASMPAEAKEFGDAQWRELYYLSHADPKHAYELYAGNYMSTSGQRYWSDTHQLSPYLDNYHDELDRRLNAKVKGSEMITELYGPRVAPGAFLAAVRADFRRHRTQHDEVGLRTAAESFRRLIDRAVELSGSYFLTYHRWASRQQVERCYPQMPEFLRLNRRYDPHEVFQSDWYRHCKMFADRR